jgi:predicted ATP-dependent endonuclease of OLD family
MYIKRLELKNYTSFDSLQLDFSPNINIISGENNIGKTNIIKALYSTTRTIDDIQTENEKPGLPPVTREKMGEMLARKLVGVYRPDYVGRLARRTTGRAHASFRIIFNNDNRFVVSFDSSAKKSVSIGGSIQRLLNSPLKSVYIPPKEIISAAENFAALYERYHIAFEETYYDLNRLLLLPAKKGPTNTRQKKLLKKLEMLAEGKVVLQQNGRFYLKAKGIGNIEMGLVAEGYRKLSTLLYLISNESLTEHSILFWDEPETNCNPQMISPLVEIMIELARIGVQVFICTHSYFLQQEFSLYSEYKAEREKLDIKFFSLYKQDGNITAESGSTLAELEHNTIMQEFNELYNKEQELFYAD